MPGDKAAEGQRPGVSHEDLGRIGIVAEEAHQRPDTALAAGRFRTPSSTEAIDEEQRDDDRHGAGQSVQAVRKIHRINRSEDREKQKRIGQKADLRHPSAGKRDAQRQGIPVPKTM